MYKFFLDIRTYKYIYVYLLCKDIHICIYMSLHMSDRYNICLTCPNTHKIFL